MVNLYYNDVANGKFLHLTRRAYDFRRFVAFCVHTTVCKSNIHIEK